MSLREPRRAQAPPVRLLQAAQDIDEGKNARASFCIKKISENSEKVENFSKTPARAETLLSADCSLRSFVCYLFASLCLF
jgi:hypothetical protein